MNQLTHFALCFYHGACVIRDCIEYAIPNREFSAQSYNFKKEAIGNILKDDSYFSAFINVEQNKEKGAEIKKNLTELYDFIFKSSYLRVEGEKVFVDKTQNVKAITHIIGLKQTFSEISEMHIAFLKQQEEKLDPKYEKLLKKEAEFFGCVASLVIAQNCFLDRFVDFNKSMRETKGETNVEANFISNEINQLVNTASFVRGKTQEKGDYVKTVIEEFSKCIDLMSGKTPLVVDKDHTLESNFVPHLNQMQLQVNALEPSLKELHKEVIDEMVAYETEMRNTQKN